MALESTNTVYMQNNVLTQLDSAQSWQVGDVHDTKMCGAVTQDGD